MNCPSEQLGLFGGFRDLDHQHPENGLALIQPPVWDLCRTLHQHIFANCLPFIANFNHAGTIQHIIEYINRS